jgi:hypothetical protein
MVVEIIIVYPVVQIKYILTVNVWSDKLSMKEQKKVKNMMNYIMNYIMKSLLKSKIMYLKMNNYVIRTIVRYALTILLVNIVSLGIIFKMEFVWDSVNEDYLGCKIKVYVYHFALKEHMEIIYKGNVCLAIVVVLLVSVVPIMIVQVVRQTHFRLLLLFIQTSHNPHKYSLQPISHHNSQNLRNIRYLAGLNGFQTTRQQFLGIFYSGYLTINPKIYLIIRIQEIEL